MILIINDLRVNNNLIIFKYIIVRQNKYLAKWRFKNIYPFKVSIWNIHLYIYNIENHNWWP